MARLELQQLHKAYGAHTVIPSLDLDIAHGEFAVVVGPSGCGKSTVLRMVAGLESISGGRVRIDGRDVTGAAPAARGVAMVFQNYALYPHMTVRENLRFGLENLKTPPAEIARRVDEAARMLQLEPLLERLPRALSGGQRQRVAIGRAVTREPGLFLFDEPLSNLDAELRLAMRAELSQLHQRLGNTMLYVTHDQVEAMTLADRIVVLRAGRVEQQGAPLALYNEPANAFVAGFLGTPRMNFLEGRLREGAFEAPGLAPWRGVGLALPEQALTLGVRPADWQVGTEDGWPAEVLWVEEHGADSILHLQLAHGPRVLCQRPGQRAARRGDALRLAPRRWHAFAADGRRLAGGAHPVSADPSAPATERP